MNEGILKFICAITGHDEDAIKQMFNDWLKSPSSNPDRASEVGVGCVVIASEQPDKVQANGAVAEDTEDGSLFIYENKELTNIKFLPKERFEKLIDALYKLVVAYRVITKSK